MTKADILLLFEYDCWANNRVLQAASALSDEQFARNTLVHIIGGEWGWLTYWKENSPSPAFLADLWDRHDALFYPDRFPNVAAVRSKWAEVEKERTEFVSCVTEEALTRMLIVRTKHVSLGRCSTW